MDITDKIRELNGKAPQHGINWSWTGFATREKAQEFITWLNDNGYEHRGIYPEQDAYDVRFR